MPALGEALGKANQLTEGKRKPTFNHAKAVAESLSCLTWILYTEKGCGEGPPPCEKGSVRRVVPRALIARSWAESPVRKLKDS